MTTKTQIEEKDIRAMFDVGLHYGYRKSRRHPSTLPYIFGTKEGIEIFDLERTAAKLGQAQEFVKELISSGKRILFVSSKPETKRIVESAADSVNQPHMTGRWIGGTLTNFAQIQKRVSRLHDLRTQKEKGELGKYTKKEQLLISREIEALESKFGGISDMDSLPGALFVIDSRKEEIAIREAQQKGIPVIALANNDCDFSGIDYVIPGNDSSRASVEYVVGKIAEVIDEAQKSAK